MPRIEVTPKLEEIVGYADGAETKDLRPYSSQNLLHPGLGQHHVRIHVTDCLVRRRQVPTVQLAVWRQRKFIEHHECRRNHIRRKLLLQVAAKARDQILHQLPLERVVGVDMWWPKRRRVWRSCETGPGSSSIKYEVEVAPWICCRPTDFRRIVISLGQRVERFGVESFGDRRL